MTNKEKIEEIVNRWKYKDGYVHIGDMIKDLEALLQEREREAVVELKEIIGAIKFKLSLEDKGTEFNKGAKFGYEQSISLINAYLKQKKPKEDVEEFCDLLDEEANLMHMPIVGVKGYKSWFHYMAHTYLKQKEGK